METGYLSIADPRCPDLLRNIVDPPGGLYYKGNAELLRSVCVSVVGARKCSEYGRWAAEELGAGLAACGVTVVSGLAAGVDAAAHRGALRNGGNTIAVLGNGTDIYYPAMNRSLQNEISRRGLVISEYPPGTSPARYTFPRRNRIISALSVATVIAEAGLESGSLITAELAAEQGRAVYAVPSNINSARGLGSNMLIRDGAMPLVVIDDLIRDLGLEPGHNEKAAAALGNDEKLVLGCVSAVTEATFDRVSAETGLPPQTVKGVVTVLEMKGLLFTAMGKIFVAK